ncbi:MAG TPA: hypothetical protein VM582_06470 [Candidatus Thermoplasmatota archaeon]|nr:hypothetical protein [Candidatus Thermoplasmatota archaeon]
MAMERPPYGTVPPGDTLGLRHLRVALQDIEYPAKTSEVRERAGSWRMPLDGAHFEPLSDWLEGVPERTFRSADDVAEAVAKAHPELRD